MKLFITDLNKARISGKILFLWGRFMLTLLAVYHPSGQLSNYN